MENGEIAIFIAFLKMSGPVNTLTHEIIGFLNIFSNKISYKFELVSI